MTQEGTWQPLVDGKLRNEALAAVQDIAKALRESPPVVGYDGTVPDPASETNFGLCTGTAGIALFFGYLAPTGLVSDAEELSQRFLAEAEAAVGEYSMGISLASGFGGIAWTHAHLHHRLGWKDQRGALAEVDRALLGVLRDWTWPNEFDLLYGLAGIGVYALERLPARAATTLAGLVIDRLAERAHQSTEFTAWSTPPVDHSLSGEEEYNLGLAHGAPGVVGFLARAAAAGIAPRKTLPLLKQATEWLLARQLPPGTGSSFPSYCTLSGTLGPPARTAWCYGDPGVASALFAAAVALENGAWQTEALRVARGAAQRPAEESRVVDAGLCHGAAGLAHLFNRFSHATRDPVMPKAALAWVRRTLDERRPGRGIAGFAARGGPDGPPELSDPGLLTGAAGIGLALLAATTSVDPAWDRLLLLDLPRGSVPRSG